MLSFATGKGEGGKGEGGTAPDGSPCLFFSFLLNSPQHMYFAPYLANTHNSDCCVEYIYFFVFLPLLNSLCYIIFVHYPSTATIPKPINKLVFVEFGPKYYYVKLCQTILNYVKLC